ncbi:ABC transporter ATP-binding protein [Streptomyces sp. NBC_01443]|uniref:ABC transporter ATP-binding protein n=1 Tax=Streptomyces sp. NBC_01443 TaxID=2903868 RepID=UPI00224F76FC|nr:ABC transporter ATP-binding protein [Streptomyces sp. NBC_01443]MCX4632516.1 ABC transporter ATP-binding protein [Streptomyces sp. NBC_01443]
MALLEYEDLHIALPSTARPVLDGITLTVAAGEVVALVGESGSGKSVTARAALGLFPPGCVTRGRVRVDGIDLVGADEAGLHEVRTAKAAMIFQDPRAAINPVRRVGDFLTESLRIGQGWPKARANARAVELLTAVGLPDPARHLDQYPHELSGGMLQRVVIAAALTTEPRLLLCDEPTTALDVSTQAETMAILGRLQRERGLGMLLITHDVELAAATSDRIYVMYAGRIVETAPVADLFATPAHPYTAGLLGSSPPLSGPAGPDGRLVPIPGAPMGLMESAPGCAFAPRCRFAEPGRCDQSPPPLRPYGPGEVACHRADELTGELSGTHTDTAATTATIPAPARTGAPDEEDR